MKGLKQIRESLNDKVKSWYASRDSDLGNALTQPLFKKGTNGKRDYVQDINDCFLCALPVYAASGLCATVLTNLPECVKAMNTAMNSGLYKVAEEVVKHL